MKTTNTTATEKIENIEKAAAAAYTRTFKKKMSISVRNQIFKEELKKYGIACDFIGEAPNSGSSFFVRKMKDCVRVNLRCGYGRNNYAPCVEIY